MMVGMLMLLGISASAKCLEYHPGETAIATVQQYISNQFWQDADGAYWQMEADGSLYFWSEQAQQYTVGRWAVQDGPLTPTLDIVLNGERRTYTLLPDCERISLTAQEETGFSNLRLSPASPQQGALAAQLAGEWQSAYADGYCQLELRRDGRLLAQRKSANGTQTLQGRWVVGRDGRTVFFHLDSCSRVEIISIKYLQMDELVVKPVCDSLLVNAGSDCYFNKL